MPVPWEAQPEQSTSGASSGVPWESPVYTQDRRAKQATTDFETKLAARNPLDAMSTRAIRLDNWKGLPATNPSELLSLYGIDPEKIGPAKAMEAFLDYKNLQSGGRSTGILDSILRGAKSSVASPIRGTGQLMNHIAASLLPGSSEAVSSSAASDLDARMRADIEERQNQGHTLAHGTGELIGGLPYAALLPESNMLKTAGIGAGFGAAQPVVSPDYAKQKFMDTITGAVAAPVAQVGLEGLVGLASKGVGAARGLATGWLPPEQANIQRNIMERLGILKNDITAADLVSRPSGITKLRDTINRAPIGGLDTINARNNVRAGNVVGRIGSTADEAMLALPPDNLTSLQNAGNDKNAARILSNVPNQANPSVGASLQSSLEGGQFQAQQNINPLYAEAERLKPTTPNDVTPVISTIDAQIAKAESLGKSARLDKIIDFLKTMKTDLQGQVDPKVQATLDMLFKTPEAKQAALAANPNLAGKPGMTDLGGLETIKGNLRSEINKINSNSVDALTGSDRSHFLTEVSHALDPIIDSATAAAPEYASAKAAANAAFTEQGLPYKDSMVTKLVSSGGERVKPDVAASAVTSFTPDETKALQSVLGPRGQAAHYNAFVDELLGSATFDATKPIGVQFDRTGFLNKAQALRASMDEASTPAQRQLMDGTIEALQYMSQLGVNKAADITRGGPLNKGFAELAATLRPVLTSDTGKALLLTLSWTKDPALKNSILQRIASTVERTAGPMGGQFNENKGNPADSIPPL